MSRIVKLGACMLVCAALSQGVAFAQTATIAGVARDASGALMPGVTVEASSTALIEKVRTVVTDGQGQYKIIDLPPGVYAVKFELSGFQTIRKEGIELTGDFTAQVNGDLKVGTVEESITVAAQSPLVDTQSITQRKAMTADIINALPTGRSFQNISVLVPGVTTGLASQDVGGTGGDRYQTLSVHGSRSDQMPLVMNGMPYNNMNNTGGGYNTTLVVNTGTVQEMTVTTSGLAAEQRSSGVLTNVVPKEGGNTFRGEFFGNFATSGMQWNNLTTELQNRGTGLSVVPGVNQLDDINPVVGGPIVKDRLWFFGGFRYDQAQNYISNGYLNLRPNAAQYCIPKTGLTACSYGDAFHPTVLVPDSRDLANRAVGGDTWSRGETLNLTLQATQRNKFTVFGHFNQRLVDCNQCSATNSPEAGVYFTHRPEYLLQATWTNPVTNRILLEGGFTFYNERWIFGPEPSQVNGYGPDAVISKSEFSLSSLLYGAANVFTTAFNHQYNMRFAANYVTGSHAFKVGMTDMWGTRQYTYDTNQAYSEVFNNGEPLNLTEYARPLIDHEHLNYALGIYAQDRWTINRLTLNLGARLDLHNASVPAQDLPAIPFVPARHYDAIDNVPNWKDFSPRLGFALDVFGNARTVLRANWAQYIQSESTNMATLNNPVNTSVNSGTRSWTDNNGNFLVDCDLTNNAAQSPTTTGSGDTCAALTTTLGSLQKSAAYDSAITSGWGVRPNDHEIDIGIQHSITHQVAVDINFSRHSFGNFFAAQNTLRPPSAYSSYCVTVPTPASGPVLSNAGQQVCGWMDLNPGFAAQFFQVQKASNFGDVSDVFTGYDMGVTARLPRGGTLSGGAGIGHEVTDGCAVIGQASIGYAGVAGVLASSAGTLGIAPGYPSTNYCRVSPPFQPDFKGLVSYPLPWWGINVSATFQNRTGPQIAANYLVVCSTAGCDPTVLSTLQASNPARTTLNAGSATVNLIPPGTLYGARVTQVDFRLGKVLRVDRYRIQLSADVFNALNSSDVLTQSNTYSLPTATTANPWQTPTSILQGRLIKISGQVSF